MGLAKYATCTSPIRPPLFAHQNFAEALFSISLGTAVIPRKMKNDGYAKFWGANKLHYGRCASGENVTGQNYIQVKIF